MLEWITRRERDGPKPTSGQAAQLSSFRQPHYFGEIVFTMRCKTDDEGLSKPAHKRKRRSRSLWLRDSPVLAMPRDVKRA
jgi:hypothetical protein